MHCSTSRTLLLLLLLLHLGACSLHAAGQRWVPIIDCGIPVVEDDTAYKQGLAADVFIKDPSGKPFIGQVVSAACTARAAAAATCAALHKNQQELMHYLQARHAATITAEQARNKSLLIGTSAICHCCDCMQLQWPAGVLYLNNVCCLACWLNVLW
jgi:hypothetical protein